MLEGYGGVVKSLGRAYARLTHSGIKPTYAQVRDFLPKRGYTGGLSPRSTGYVSQAVARYTCRVKITKPSLKYEVSLSYTQG